MTIYSNKPARLLACLLDDFSGPEAKGSFCAGFEVEKWRCEAFANHLMDWIADFALKEEELKVNHGNMFVRLREAAVRIYSSDKYEKRGEVGELALHAICRDFFDTVPIAPRVFYLTSSNDVVKSFDLVHVRYAGASAFELWLGEAKLYKDADTAVTAAIASIHEHIEQGFLNREKLLLGPQISKDIPRHEEIRALLSAQASLDSLFASAVFPVCIMANSHAAASAKSQAPPYSEQVAAELMKLNQRISASGLRQKIKLFLIYTPLASKDSLIDAFDKKLKALSA